MGSVHEHPRRSEGIRRQRQARIDGYLTRIVDKQREVERQREALRHLRADYEESMRCLRVQVVDAVGYTLLATYALLFLLIVW